jgi:hypothetical protein
VQPPTRSTLPPLEIQRGGYLDGVRIDLDHAPQGRAAAIQHINAAQICVHEVGRGGLAGCQVRLEVVDGCFDEVWSVYPFTPDREMPSIKKRCRKMYMTMIGMITIIEPAISCGQYVM